MAHIRIRPNGRIQFDLHLYGQRFREGTKLEATPKNLKQAKTKLAKINAEITLGTFQYRQHFPHSKKVPVFEALEREQHPDHRYPFFNEYANEWFERQKAKWKSSYQQTVWLNLTRYLLPEFGNTLLGELTLADVEHFRNRLIEQTKSNGQRRLSNHRINNILWPLVAILSLGADEYEFNYPLRRYKALRETRADSNPLSAAELKRFFQALDPDWHDYFLVRFYTGLRSCELHGLHDEHLDFEHRLIRVRQNYVNGELGELKTTGSRRDLKMNEAVFEALERTVARKTINTPFVFTNPNGAPLDTHYVSKKLWYPTLEKAQLSRRRPYETRHTAAVLHIAAHENPLYISHMLGHSTTKLLFEVYAPYVANASRQDGNAFNALMKENLL
ncbi:Arm DNA-binding domain-containing protein [Vibrio cyclitrophicus]